jgi:aminotransferase in exopolysaccharide biosynthesis
MHAEFIRFVRDAYKEPVNDIPLHMPVFSGREKEYVLEALDSKMVSTVGPGIAKLEEEFASLICSKYAVAIVNGTVALQIGLTLVGVDRSCEVITQALSFVATANAISHAGASCVFIDVEDTTLGMSPQALRTFLEEYAEIKDGQAYNKQTGKRFGAVVPMHTFGFPCNIEEIEQVCRDYGIPLVEDAAEALGSSVKGRSVGTFGKVSAFSFNGNKIATAGGGGMLVTNDVELRNRAKHLINTAKVPHSWAYYHDEVGYNYGMPNLNASLLRAQLEQLDYFVDQKRELSRLYQVFFKQYPDARYWKEPSDTKANYWLNTLIFKNREERDEFLELTNASGIKTRPVWQLLNSLPMYENCQSDALIHSSDLVGRLLNIPSSVLGLEISRRDV